MNQPTPRFVQHDFPMVVIVGRPNVGKSTLFNRILGKRDAIVDDQPGVTRDSKFRITDWNGKTFYIVDTGGMFGPDTDPFSEVIQKQIEFSAREASLLLFLVDGQDGPTPADHEVLMELRKLHKPILIVVNKVDSPEKDEEYASMFYELGLDELFPVSSLHGLGIGDLLDAIVEYLPETGSIEREETRLPGIAILGRPNVGKSTLLNSLCGTDRAIVSPVAGTTRDPVDTVVEYEGNRYLLIDTAGIKRRGKMSQGLDQYSLMRGKEALERCDVALLMIDGGEGLTETDAKVFSLSKDAGKAAIILVNKWDTVEKDTHTAGAFAKEIKERLPFLHFAPIEFISALTRQRVQRIFPHVNRILESYNRRVQTAVLNDLLERILQQHPPPTHKGRPAKIYYWTQVSTAPPTFVAFVNEPKGIHFSYERYLINRLYDTFDFSGTPIRLIWKKRGARRI